MGELRNAQTILVGKPEAKSLLGKDIRRWKGHIKVNKVNEYEMDSLGVEVCNGGLS